MDTANDSYLKHELYKKDNRFRALVDKHRKYEKRLEELASLAHPNEEEIEEESKLKRKKLAVKDEIYGILEQY